MTLQDRTAVITGATGELGSVLARELAACGVKLVLLSRDADKLDALATNLAIPESRVVKIPVDLLDYAATKAAARAVAARFGRIDILLHTVGGWTGGKTLLEAPPADLELMLNQHVWTSFNVVQSFLPYMLNNGWGRIVMVTSPSATRPNPKGGPYAIGKAGQEALMLTLAQELRGTGVTANLLQVKAIDVERQKVAAPSAENASWTTPEEICAAVLFLLSDEASTINGARIPLFGGYN